MQIPQSLLLDIAKGRTDPVFFAKTFLGIDLHEGQRAWLLNSKAHINVLVPANRYGKSVTLAVKHIWMCFYKIGLGKAKQQAWANSDYPTLNLAPHSDLSKIVFDYIRSIIAGNFAIKDLETGKVNSNKSLIPWFIAKERELPIQAIDFWNGSRFTSRTTGEDQGDSIQGRAYAYVSYDECCRSHHLQYEVDSNLLPRLTDFNGPLDLVSTPDRDSPSLIAYYAFYKKGIDREPGFYAQEGTVYDNPYISKVSVDSRKSIVDQATSDQTLFGKFIFSGSAEFNAAEIMEMFDDKMEFASVKQNRDYVMSVDLARGSDFTVIYVGDVTDYKLNQGPITICRSERFQGSTKYAQVQAQVIREIYSHYRKYGGFVDVIIDSTGFGGKVMSDLIMDVGPDNIDITGKNRGDLLANLRQFIALKKIKSPLIKELRDELSIFREDAKDVHDDCVFSLALLAWKARSVDMPLPYSLGSTMPE